MGFNEPTRLTQVDLEVKVQVAAELANDPLEGFTQELADVVAAAKLLMRKHSMSRSVSLAVGAERMQTPRGCHLWYSACDELEGRLRRRG